MSDDYETQAFETPEELIAYLTEHCDDFDDVTIMVANDLYMGDSKSETLDRIPDHCCQINTCGGRPILLTPDFAARLLNSGVLQRLSIPVILLPIEQR